MRGRLYVLGRWLKTAFQQANWNLRNPCEIEEFFEKCEIIWKLRNNLENAKHLNKLNLVSKSGKCEKIWKLRNYLENAKH